MLATTEEPGLFNTLFSAPDSLYFKSMSLINGAKKRSL